MQALRNAGLLILGAAVCWPAAASNSAVGHTYISYDPSSKIVTATCRTDLDMYAQAWYQAVVLCTVSDSAGTVLVSKQATDTTGELGYATVTVTVTGTSGVTYKAVGKHSVLVTVETDIVAPPSRTFNDYYYYQYFTADGESQIYSPGANTWYGPGPQRQITTHSLPLGYTYDSAPTAPTVVVRTSGLKTTGDNLSFSNSTSSCSESLGLLNCAPPAYWVWNVEIKAVVGDDASKWTVSQTASVRYKGNTKDSSGTLQAFDVTEPTEMDNPNSVFVQQTSGQKNIFWLDDPGFEKTWNGQAVDSVTEVMNFASSVCSTKVPSLCGSYNWHIKLIVKPGAVLDTANSDAGQGWLSTSF